MVILITGKKGSGKTTYATRLAEDLKKDGKSVEILDGDAYRYLHGNEDYSDQGRIRNLMGAAEEAAKLEEEGNIVLLSFIAPRREWRDMMRAQWEESVVVYIPGGTLWEGTTYEMPTEDELMSHMLKYIT